MGTNLLGYLLTGPTHLDAASIQAAEARIQLVLDQQIELSDIWDGPVEGEESGTEQVIDLLENDERIMGVTGLAMTGSQNDDIPYYLKLQLLGSHSTPGDFMDEFVAAWNGDYRDSMSRVFTDPMTGQNDPNYQIITAGELSWGDGPEEGGAWWIFDRASWFDLFRLLHIH